MARAFRLCPIQGSRQDTVANRVSEPTPAGTVVCACDAGNRLTNVLQGANAYAFAYNGLGDRLRQTVNGAPTTYTLDLAAGLTQILADGTNTYLYGLGRTGEQQPTGWAYHLGDALGSVRHLADPSGSLMLARGYEPYGEALASASRGATAYGYAGEWGDATGLVHLRARYYAPGQGQFLTRDEWAGDVTRPLSLNQWGYVEGDPVNRVDPSGWIAEGAEDYYATWTLAILKAEYNVQVSKDWGYQITFPYPLGNDAGPIPLPPGAISCNWEEGAWDLRELSWVRDAVRSTSTAMGGAGKFKSAFGPIRITRWSTSRWTAFAPPVGSQAMGDIVLTDYTFSSGEDGAKYGVAHELGHVWDHRSGHRLSSGLMQALGTIQCGEGGCGWYPFAKRYDPATDSFVSPETAPGTDPTCSLNDMVYQRGGCKLPYASTFGGTGSILTGAGWEDWAESFASTVYPGYYPSLRLTGLVPGGIRERYVRDQISAIP